MSGPLKLLCVPSVFALVRVMVARALNSRIKRTDHMSGPPEHFSQTNKAKVCVRNFFKSAGALEGPIFFAQFVRISYP